jgi:hypothetical protein
MEVGMSSKAERVTRFDPDLFEAAAVEGARQSRSARQQLHHWARLGRAFSAQFEAPMNRVRLALEGQVAQRDLTDEEARSFDAAIAVRIEEAVSRADFASAGLPDFSPVSPKPDEVLQQWAAHNSQGAEARHRLVTALDEIRALVDEQEPVEARR